VSDDGNLNGGMVDSPLVNDAVVGVVYVAPGDEPAASPESTPPARESKRQASFDPGEHTVADVHDYIAAHPDQADAVLAAERAGKARATLIGVEGD